MKPIMHGDRIEEWQLVALLNPKHEQNCPWPSGNCGCPVGERLLRLLCALNNRPYLTATP